MRTSIIIFSYSESNMKICYLGYLRIPTEKAHGFQIMKMCEAFASLGHEVELIIPKRKNLLVEDPFAYYGIPTNTFSVHEISVGTFDLYHTAGWLIKIKNAYYSFRYLLRLTRQEIPVGTLVYTRNATIAGWIGFRFPELPLIYEAHGVPKHFLLHRFLLQKVKFVVAITQGIVDDYRARGYSGRMIVEPDAVDPEMFTGSIDQRTIRRELGLPLEISLAVYTGSFSLYSWKGVDVLIKAAEYLPENIRVVLVGGSSEEINRMKLSVLSERFIFIPRVARKMVAKYLCAADVLVLPNTKGDLASERYTSPLKLFEYMTSGTSIVASNLPSIREILDEQTAIFVEPNDPLGLANGIIEVLHNTVTATARAQEARKKVEYYTWELRSKRIIEAFSEER